MFPSSYGAVTAAACCIKNQEKDLCFDTMSIRDITGMNFFLIIITNTQYIHQFVVLRSYFRKEDNQHPITIGMLINRKYDSSNFLMCRDLHSSRQHLQMDFCFFAMHPHQSLSRLMFSFSPNIRNSKQVKKIPKTLF